ncbi:immune inhibitor A domain-containing protein [Plantactinospora sp. KBS50]|uniref:immune inhibitor A domain-containing protein n=1 Tax=Plantactinospora sp. KBS50 TaxID=2024580 RepID=UPI000BAA9D7D|nr:immune inhibitor A domain-containing protein [Plantactinospora sp. KBS50]ASW53241.1 protease [Plantactinospora sp. KBS50]
MGLLGLSLTATGVALGPSAMAAPVSKAAAVTPAAADAAPQRDELPNPLEDKRRALRQEGLTSVLNGESKAEKRNGSTVVKVGETAGSGIAGKGARALVGGKTAKKKKDQYVELAREKTDHIFVILAEFGNERHPNYPDQDTDPNTPGPTRFDGPLNNEIPEPNRAVDNTTVWQPDYDADHYRQMYFGTGKGVESLKTYYETQSSGRYSVDGEVTDWVRVQYNEARYGRSNGYPCGSSVCNNVWALVRDAANQWVADQKAQGRTDAEIAEDVKQFDQWDRYDYDGDGDFNEPDGYIDHFQIVHAGGDQADGDPYQGEDAIWSHRWYAYGSDIGRTGPADNPLGGTQIGDTGLWIGDYTMQPENGGLSVFCHEYGHDLGLPDDYDTNGAGDNAVEHWSLMAQSRLNAKDDQALGTRPGDIGAWQKLQLGWLDYEVVVAGQKRTLNLGPQEYNSAKAQAVVVPLPKKSVTTDLGAPFEGSKQYFSGNADDLNNTMTREFDLTGATSASLSMKARYSIEEGYDYMYLETSTDGGQSWTAMDGTVGGEAFDHDASGTPAIDGSSGGAWVDLNVPLDSVAGQNVLFRFHYRTDGGVSEGGMFGDAITVTADGSTVFSDGAESDAGWALKGFSVVGASVTNLYDNYYIAGNRSYVSYDKYLKTGPYYFSYMNSRPDYVDHYPYQQGLLISYWDTSQVDNNVSDHPGEGLNLYIDAHPRPIYNLTGNPWRVRVQIYDAPFSLKKADSFTLHINGQPQYIRGQDAQPLFNDTKNYFDPALPNHGVKLPAAGVKIKVLEQNGTSMKIRIS